MNDVINFSDFFKSNNGKKLPNFNKEEILDEFFLEDEITEENVESIEVQTETNSETLIESDIPTSSEDTIEESKEESQNESKFLDKDEIEKMIQQEIQRIKSQTIEENRVNEQVEISTQEDLTSNESEEIEEVVEEDSNSNFESDSYKVFADKSETFSCEIELEGANLKDTQVRLVLESDNWNLMFPGEIDKNGKVTIPIRKLNIFDEGTKGTIKMEVIAEGTVFVPWEDNFEVKLSKKVMVKFNENKTSKFKQPNTSIKVNLKK